MSVPEAQKILLHCNISLVWHEVRVTLPQACSDPCAGDILEMHYEYQSLHPVHLVSPLSCTTKQKEMHGTVLQLHRCKIVPPGLMQAVLVIPVSVQKPLQHTRLPGQMTANCPFWCYSKLFKGV